MKRARIFMRFHQYLVSLLSNNSNIDKHHENFSTVNHNPNISITRTDCFAELKTFRLKKKLKNLLITNGTLKHATSTLIPLEINWNL